MADPTFVQGTIPVPRQAGGLPSGRKLIGNAHLRTKPSAPSIPSRFETTVSPTPPPSSPTSNASTSNNFAFSSRTSRFQPALSCQDVGPGPGSYSLLPPKPSTLLRDRASHSSRGFGNGFASREPRFLHSFLGDLVHPNAAPSPGPGYYSTDHVHSSFQQSSSARVPAPCVGFGSSSYSSSSTSSPSGASTAELPTSTTHPAGALVSPAQSSTPGPGAYDVRDPRPGLARHPRRQQRNHLRLRLPLHNSAPSIPISARLAALGAAPTAPTPPALPRGFHSALSEPAFATTAPRFLAPDPRRAPDPGSYDLARPHRAAASSGAGTAGVSAAFASRTARGSLSGGGGSGGGGGLDVPGPGAYQLGSDFASVSLATALGGDGAMSAERVTGLHPGVRLQGSIARDPTIPSFMFAARTSDRFGRPLRPRVAAQVTPGPGAYHDHIVTDATAGPAASAAFLSSPRQPMISPSLAPGPGVYNPHKELLTKKTSYHLNSKSPPHWVA